MPPPFNLPPVRQQGRDYSVTPTFQSGPMQPRGAVESFDLTRNLSPGRSLVTGDRSLTRNPGGMAGLPLAPMSEQIGSRGMTEQRRSEMAGRRLSSAMRAGDMQATALLYRGPTGYGRGFGQPPGRGYLPPVQRPDSLMPPPAPAAPQAPAMPALPPPMSAEQALGRPGFGEPADGGNQPPPMPMPSNLPWQSQPLPGMPMGALPPSTFNGGAGLPPPAPFSVQSAGGWDAFTQTMPDGSTKFLNARPTPEAQPTPLSAAELGRIRAAGYAPAEVGGRSFDAQGVPYLQPLPQATEKITEGPTGTTRTYTQPRGTQAAPPAGEGGSNYFDSLLPAAPTASTQTGQMPAAPTASTQTGQMPNVAYAAPINPAQLLDEARNEYARTGNDTALKQYFAQYPSEAVQINQAEQQIWKQMAKEGADIEATQQAQMDAFNEREQYIQGILTNPFGAMGAGSASRDWEAKNPAKAALMSRPLPVRDRTLIAQANRKNAQFEAARQGLPVPADWADDPGRVPALPPLPLPTPQRPFWQSVGMGASAMGNDLGQMPGRLADYARKHPLLTIRR